MSKRLRDMPLPMLNPEIMMWVEAFCSCAIEGNALGERMCNLWNTDRGQFLDELEDMLTGKKVWDDENGWVNVGS